MNKRQFEKSFKALCDAKTKLLDVARVEEMSAEAKDEMISFLVRERQPLVEPLLVSYSKMPWLHAMGYNVWIQGNSFRFFCTPENRLMIEKGTK